MKEEIYNNYLFVKLYIIWYLYYVLLYMKFQSIRNFGIAIHIIVIQKTFINVQFDRTINLIC